MNKGRSAKDRLGNIVKEGDTIRLLFINWNGVKDLSEKEQQDLKTMIGEAYNVEGIDKYGSIWITKWWDSGVSEKRSHSFALGPEEFEKINMTR